MYINTQNFTVPEQGFVLSELRAKLLLAGVQLAQTQETAQVVMEVRSGGLGIDRSDFLLGVPSLFLRAGGDSEIAGDISGVPIATPELAAVKNINQVGVASIAFIAYWKETGEVVATSGPHMGWTLRDDWWFLGLGRRTVGDIPPTEAPQ